MKDVVSVKNCLVVRLEGMFSMVVCFYLRSFSSVEVRDFGRWFDLFGVFGVNKFVDW